MKAGVTLKEVALKIGEEFAEDHERAKIWENGAKFPGQEVSISKEALEEEAKKSKNVAKHLKDKEIKKTIVVPDKLVNFVTG